MAGSGTGAASTSRSRRGNGAAGKRWAPPRQRAHRGPGRVQPQGPQAGHDPEDDHEDGREEDEAVAVHDRASYWSRMYSRSSSMRLGDLLLMNSAPAASAKVGRRSQNAH